MSLYGYNSNELQATERMTDLRTFAQTRNAAQTRTTARAGRRFRPIRWIRQTTGKSGSSNSAPAGITPRSSSNGGDVTQSLGACVASPAR